MRAGKLIPKVTTGFALLLISSLSTSPSAKQSLLRPISCWLGPFQKKSLEGFAPFITLSEHSLPFDNPATTILVFKALRLHPSDLVSTFYTQSDSGDFGVMTATVLKSFALGTCFFKRYAHRSSDHE
jgi:hypothetical protein